jgi:hypothetical protein
MTDSPANDSGRLRIGSAEREQAMRLLSRQFSEGRLDVDEFSGRSAQISAAVTRADLEPIFADLPVKPTRRPPLSARCAASQLRCSGLRCSADVPACPQGKFVFASVKWALPQGLP